MAKIPDVPELIDWLDEISRNAFGKTFDQLNAFETMKLLDAISERWGKRDAR